MFSFTKEDLKNSLKHIDSQRKNFTNVIHNAHMHNAVSKNGQVNSNKGLSALRGNSQSDLTLEVKPHGKRQYVNAKR